MTFWKLKAQAIMRAYSVFWEDLYQQYGLGYRNLTRPMPHFKSIKVVQVLLNSCIPVHVAGTDLPKTHIVNKIALLKTRIYTVLVLVLVPSFQTATTTTTTTTNNRLVDWSIDWLIDRLIDWSIDWLINGLEINKPSHSHVKKTMEIRVTQRHRGADRCGYY